jgi:hypothetical protein
MGGSSIGRWHRCSYAGVKSLERSETPRHQCIEVSVAVTICELCEDLGEPSERIDAIELCSLQEARNDSPIVGPKIRARKEAVPARNSGRYPFQGSVGGT